MATGQATYANVRVSYWAECHAPTGTYRVMAHSRTTGTGMVRDDMTPDAARRHARYLNECELKAARDRVYEHPYR